MIQQNITSWSYSRYSTWKQCPGKAKLLYIEKLKEPDSPALLNGQKKHTELEYFLKGYSPLPDWVHKNSKPYAEGLKERKAVPELQVAFNDKWQPVEWFAKNAWARIKIDVIDNSVPGVTDIKDWKGLALDTQLPTPTGFTTMANISVGDTVFDMHGQPTTVVGKSQVKTLQLFEVRFKDGAKVTCDEEHLWRMLDGTVKCVTDVHKGDRIPMQAAVSLQEIDLPVHPYLLGYWLGNGRKRDGSICVPVPAVIQYVELLGYSVGKNISGKRAKDIAVHTVHGLRGKLAELGLLNNKHIPAMYLRASITQRLALLQGLMDSDGHANNHRQEAVFSNTNKNILRGFRELLSSLGVRFRSNSGEAHGFGVTCQATQVAFRMPEGMRAFCVGYKAEREATWERVAQNFREVQSVTPKGLSQSQCISVDAPTNTYLCTNRFVVTHNTGKIRDGEYDEQLELYGLTGLLMFPDREKAIAELHFPELGVTIPRSEYLQENRDQLRNLWESRVSAMLDDVTFEYTPNTYCRYCHFRKTNGGPCTANI